MCEVENARTKQKSAAKQYKKEWGGGDKERQKYNASLFYPGSQSRGVKKNVKKNMVANF